MADGPKPPKGWLIASLVCFLLALGGCGTGIAGLTTVAGTVDDIATTTPFGETTSFTAASDTGALVLLTDPADCTGTDGSGSSISFSTPSGSFTADANGQSFTEAQTFDTKDGESYELSCGSSDRIGGEYTVLKLPSFPGGLAGLAFAILGGFGLGGLLFIAAIIFLIVGLVRRSGWKKRNAGFAPVGGPPPPGGFPPPPGGAVPPAPGQAPYGQPAPGQAPYGQPAPGQAPYGQPAPPPPASPPPPAGPTPASPPPAGPPPASPPPPSGPATPPPPPPPTGGA
ncbi:hypothetical protein [Dermatobacter hominis]|uniref:hypothetical protein n=1 Tax=Dermatobacter hominis TaxID=2884263 RepID=UPI001D0FCF03|nr:hypothetical protein [Dermatobacter hominis]UDY36813.1 hypothetical protein LH044_04570 [Dermatobacter hominis]